MKKTEKVKKKAPFYTIGDRTVNLIEADLIKEEIHSLTNRESNIIFDSKCIEDICIRAMSLFYVNVEMLKLNEFFLLKHILTEGKKLGMDRITRRRK